MPVDTPTLIRALRRAVFTDKLLTLDDARRYCSLVGLPLSALDEA